MNIDRNNESKEMSEMIMTISRVYFRNGRGSEHRGQGKILSILYDQGPLSMNDIGKQLGIAAGSASEMVKKLEQKGFICKAQDTNDKRRVDITITASGREHVETHRSYRQQRIHNRQSASINRDPFASLSDEELKTLKELLAKVLTDLD